MADKPSFDIDHAHKYFSANCFNMAWELIERLDRTLEEDEEMIRLAHTALWHWTQRPDCNSKNLSIGYWQTSRIYALLGESNNALKYAKLCLDMTPADEPFFLGYAYEALARAESIANNGAKAKVHLAEAWHHAESVMKDDDKQLLVKDLKSLEQARNKGIER